MGGYGQVLRDRVAGALFISSTISSLGDWVGFAALVVLAFERSGNAIGPAALFTVQGAAAGVSSVVAGPWMDRVDRRNGIVAGYLVGGLAMSLPLLSDQTWSLYVAVALIGAVRPLTAALRHATAAHDLPPGLLGPTIALEGSTGQFVVAIGLAVGGGVAVAIGATTAIGLDVATFLVAGVQALRLPHGRGGAGRQRHRWSAGYRATFADARTTRLALLLLLSAFVGALPESLAPLGSQGADAGANWLPWVLSAQALGTALASFAVGLGRRFEQPSGLMALVLGSAVMLLVAAFVFDSHPALLGVANLLFGLGFAFTITARTAFTRALDRRRLGAAVAATITMTMASEAVGSLTLAALADAVSPSAAYAAAAAVLLAAGILVLMLPRRRHAVLA